MDRLVLRGVNSYMDRLELQGVIHIWTGIGVRGVIHLLAIWYVIYLGVIHERTGKCFHALHCT